MCRETTKKRKERLNDKEKVPTFTIVTNKIKMGDNRKESQTPELTEVMYTVAAHRFQLLESSFSKGKNSRKVQQR